MVVDWVGAGAGAGAGTGAGAVDVAVEVRGAAFTGAGGLSDFLVGALRPEAVGAFRPEFDPGRGRKEVTEEGLGRLPDKRLGG